ncbi:MAG: NAD(P)/FAD-dependent oxidoreductase [Alphaproteobacteria bacterium]|nr:NAD(P)/FAD-dependent oxidoreductase [Alphaproteobacteria bacterium]
MSTKFDVVIVGGGHNGLTCAAYLAKAGRRVLVVEASDRLGGAAANRELAPGITGPGCAHILHQLHPALRKQLKLDKHGLELAARQLHTVSLGEDGRHMVLTGTRVDGLGDSPDREAWPALHRRLMRMAGALHPSLSQTAPRLGGGDWRDQLALAKLGIRLRLLGKKHMREFLRIVNMNVFDLLNDELSDERLKGVLAFDAVLGSNFGPRSPGSVLTWLYRLAGDVGSSDGLAIPRGGMGAVAEALANAARSYGAEIRTGSPVRRVLVDGDRACGIELEGGETIAAGLVVSNADPKRTFLSLLGAEHLDTGFIRRLNGFRSNGLAAKLNLVLEGVPAFTGLESTLLGGRLVLAPDMGYIERAFDHAKYGEYSSAPALEITIPTLHDDSLASAGRHVMSVVVQYAPYALKAGWEGSREGFADHVVARIESLAPGLSGQIVAREMLAPPDLEREFGMTGGHWHHGDLSVDQMLMLRPVPGFAQYASPVPGLYLCGAGTHPGGGVMGAAGMNAAKRILAKEASS